MTEPEIPSGGDAIEPVTATEQSGGLDAILGGGGQGGFDFGSLLGAAQQMQAQMQQAQAEIEATTFEGVSGGGMVKVTVTGGMSFTGISIDPAVVDPSDVSMLEDLVIAAISDAASQVANAQQSSVGSVLPPGMSDSLSGLFGG